MTLLQNLTETDLRRYETPPARRDAAESLANVIIIEPGMQCFVCLDDFEKFSSGSWFRNSSLILRSALAWLTYSTSSHATLHSSDLSSASQTSVASFTFSSIISDSFSSLIFVPLYFAVALIAIASLIRLGSVRLT
ncbi:hypothetical protein Bca52824_084636 [Brassica carinata]|uniref:Uncharacterized protein n=1 Tax=Brassica carinata TaxID=52824 RepID=A0A8X7PNU3_BRACI|nr:hypothetical protein Bca52824_084636 [Brassica carinata]